MKETILKRCREYPNHYEHAITLLKHGTDAEKLNAAEELFRVACADYTKEEKRIYLFNLLITADVKKEAPKKRGRPSTKK